MWKRLKDGALLVYRAGDNLVENHGLETAGYLTFLALVAVFPFLVLIVAAAGLVGQGKSGQEFITLLLNNMPQDAVAALAPRIHEITSGPPQHMLTFAVLGAIWTSSSAIEAVRGTLNRAYRVHKPPAYFRRRMLSVVQVIILTSLILVVMLAFVVLPLVFDAINRHTGIVFPAGVHHFMQSYLGDMATLALFVVVSTFYYVLPNIQQRWMTVFPGALLVVVAWVMAVKIVGFYLTSLTNVTLIYGSLSGFIVSLIFLYVLNVIFIYGAEFNHEFMRIAGLSTVEKEPGAEAP